MGAKRESTSTLLKRWKKKVESDSELRGEVHKSALQLLSGIRLFVEDKQQRLVEDVVSDAALIPVSSERQAYVV